MFIAYVILLGTIIVTKAAWMDAELESLLIGHPYSIHYHGEWHRLLTPALIHGDLMHLLFNMLALHGFARRVMGYLYGVGWRIFSPVIFFMLYIGAIFAAEGMMYYLHWQDNMHYHMGASAGVVGVMAAAVVCNPTMTFYPFFMPVGIPGILFLPVYLLVSLALKDSPSQIGHFAHFIGGVFGLVFMLLIRSLGFNRAQKRDSGTQAPWR